MTEITRVPLQPIGKGSLTKLWLGVAVVALLGASVAYATMPASVDVDTITAGNGPSPTREDVALINYKGTLPDGKVFDEGKSAVLPLSEVVPGFTKALEQMQRGGKYKVHIPSELGYGEKGAGPIPPNTDLNFEIELLDFKSRADIEQQQRIMQQLQQMQGGAGAAGAGMPVGPAGVPQGAPGGAPQSVPPTQ
jgi:FKBP-type peptidyl-prolyl cis-trans isomerase FkpA